MSGARVSKQRKRYAVGWHDDHLCLLAEQYYHIHEPVRFRSLVRNPRFKCEFCGRTAAQARNLCYPAPL